MANAPCSWGALEFEGIASELVPYDRMLDELKATGYAGVELGDWGYMPTDPVCLRPELDRRGLTMVGAFVPVALRDRAAHGPGEEHAVRVARLLAAVSDANDAPRPWLILADDNGADPIRTQEAGRITPEMGLDEVDWQTFTGGADRIARAVLDQTGLRTLFHHHCAGFVETPDEIARFLDDTDPSLIGLVFDTGHYLYGSGNARAASAREGLDRFASRIQHVHLKDCDPEIAERGRTDGWDYFMAVRHGVFCELGKGNASFGEIVGWLRQRDYQGWAVVEQDVLPGLGSPRASAERNRDYLRRFAL
ncbi:MAG TPA: TIM barrel protein [Thermomicrobiales bacterium]|nr:TIM barrel protein [Thermomicrobiales bacterium]